MRHPLLKTHDELRKRVMLFLQNGLYNRRIGNLIFVCGGNSEHHLRPKFNLYASIHLKEFEIFQPEFAINTYFSDDEPYQLDLTDFESLISKLSHAVVIFPEGPGSFAETGYFSNISEVAKKTILVLDMDQQKNDSFIMMGPARKIDSISIYSPNIQLDYKNPDFEVIKNKINRKPIASSLKQIETDENCTEYDLFCLIYKIFDILIIATMDDVLFVLQSLFDGHPRRKMAKDVTAILVGAKYLRKIGNFGHYTINRKDSMIVTTKRGFIEKERDLKIEIAGIILSTDADLADVLKERSHAN